MARQGLKLDKFIIRALMPWRIDDVLSNDRISSEDRPTTHQPLESVRRLRKVEQIENRIATPKRAFRALFSLSMSASSTPGSRARSARDLPVVPLVNLGGQHD